MMPMSMGRRRSCVRAPFGVGATVSCAVGAAWPPVKSGEPQREQKDCVSTVLRLHRGHWTMSISSWTTEETAGTRWPRQR